MGKLRETLSRLSHEDLERLTYDWLVWARDDQLPRQSTDAGKPWHTWLLMGGRGAGKTRAGAEWVRAQALGQPPLAHERCKRIALVGETLNDARSIMIDGVSGLLALHRETDRPVYEPSRKRLVWPNGAIAQIFSAEDPDSLRGPQFDAAWCDEICKWRHAGETWDMLLFGLRLGTDPRVVATTTPRPSPLVKRLLSDAGTIVSRASTYDNACNLAPTFLRAIEERYGGTRLGRQELNGELLEDRQDALWSRSELDAHRLRQAPALHRIVVAVDPPVTSGPSSDLCGILACGIDGGGQGYVLGDYSIAGHRPLEWARRAVSVYRDVEADRLVAEVNQGGEMVETIIHQIDPNIAVRPVRASRGKWTRAEPVAALYAQGRVHHIGTLRDLEDQMCDFGPDGLAGGRSPDRVDALVWALTELLLTGSGQPRLRPV